MKKIFSSKKKCRLCKNDKLIKVLKLPSIYPGEQLKKNKKEKVYKVPIDLYQCTNCWHVQITDIPVIASGGVGSISDLLSLTKFEHSGLCGVIVGKALYENIFTISEANNIFSSEKINDIPFNKDYYA